MVKQQMANYGCDWNKYESLSIDFALPDTGRHKFVITKVKGGTVQKEGKNKGQPYIWLLCTQVEDGEKTDKSFTKFLSLSPKKNDKGNRPIQVTKSWLEAVKAHDYMASGTNGDIKLLEGLEFYADISYRTNDNGEKTAVDKNVVSAAAEEGTDDSDTSDTDEDTDDSSDSEDDEEDDSLDEDPEEEEEKPKAKGGKKVKAF